MTEYEAQLQIYYEFFKNGNLVVPNTYNFLGEMDMLILTRAGYASEYEIKVSRSDLLCDRFKISKHQYYQNVFSKVTTKTRGIPNRFCYVIPYGIDWKSFKLPEYAGLYIIKDGKLDCFKKPPLIHKKKNSFYWIMQIVRSLNAKYFYHYFIQTDTRNSVTGKKS